MLKDRINAVLARTTGYQLRRVGANAGARQAHPAKKAAPVPAKKAASVPAKKAAAAPPAKKAAAKPAKKPGGGLPRHYDEASRAVIRRVKPRTMTGHEKLYGLVMATRYVHRHQIPGEIVECGVWRGGSMQAAAYTLLEAGGADRHLHLFDTFEGMPPPTEKDRRGDKTAAEMLEASGPKSKVWAIASLEDVREAMDETGYPSELIHYHPGMVEDTVPADAPDQIAILRLDTDWYESTRHNLDQLYDRLSPGGVLIIDDYGGWEGARLATHEFLDKTKAPLLLLPLAGGRIAVKPGLV